jgi:L-amino acid N-acyltransferase YncA
VIRLRLADPADGPALAAIYRPAVTSLATSFETDAPDGEEMARRVAATLPALPWLVGDAAGEVVGYAYASRHRARAAYQWSVEVSAYVGAAWHRRGVGRALYLALFEILALAGYRNAYAGITLPNPASEGLHRALGFVPVGVYHGIGWKMGRWHDVLWLERPIGSREGEPPAPCPVSELAAVAVDAVLRRAVPPAERGPA